MIYLLRSIFRSYWFDTALVVLTTSIFISSVFYGADMFRRSGAVLILCGVVIEFRHLSLSVKKLMDMEYDQIGQGFSKSVTETDLMPYLSKVAIAIIVVGTIISAYGDIIYSHLGG